MKRLLFAGIALAGLVGFGASQVQAQGYEWYGGHSHGWRNAPAYGGYGYGGYGYGQRGYFRGGYGGAYRPHYDYHDTTHLDYHPRTARRHFDHYDYTPGHYDVHRSGHWDRH